MAVLYNCEGHDIILDCTALDYITSSGLRLFLNLLKHARSKDSKVILLGLHDDIRAVLDEVGFTTIFEIR
jgi:anti-sigma B factor antagonist